MLFIRRLLDHLIPPKCALCRQPSPLGFCTSCQILLPWKIQFCDICANESTFNGICGQCQQHRPAYRKAIIPFHYREPITDLVHQYKYQQKLYYGPSLAKMMARFAKQQGDTKSDLLIPIPLHNRRMRERGFNQALELTRALSRELAVPLDPFLLKRDKNTRSQTGLTEKMRRSNIQGAFSLRRDCPNVNIALVDDVVTSGNTVNEATKTLLKQGAKSVTIWAVSKTDSSVLFDYPEETSSRTD